MTTENPMPQEALAESWEVASYPSGTTVVKAKQPDVPWLYIYGPKPVGPKDDEGEDTQAEQNRYRVCEEVAAYMSGGPRPAWLDDMRRVSEEKLEGVDGSCIFAVGPTEKDETHPNGWDYREDQAAKDMRARLIDRLHLA